MTDARTHLLCIGDGEVLFELFERSNSRWTEWRELSNSRLLGQVLQPGAFHKNAKPDQSKLTKDVSQSRCLLSVASGDINLSYPHNHISPVLTHPMDTQLLAPSDPIAPLSVAKRRRHSFSSDPFILSTRVLLMDGEGTLGETSVARVRKRYRARWRLANLAVRSRIDGCCRKQLRAGHVFIIPLHCRTVVDVSTLRDCGANLAKMTSSSVACVRMCSQGHIDGFHSEQRLFFDDATRLILVPRRDRIEAYDLPTGRLFYVTLLLFGGTLVV